MASLWSVFPLFELADAVAIAAPTAANKATVEAMGKGAESYLDPNTGPPAFVTYPGITDPKRHVYFDDNGWFEIAFLDAYQATRDPRFLHDAETAYAFIAERGWDRTAAASGGRPSTVTSPPSRWPPRSGAAFASTRSRSSRGT